jgi:hypothetical protein
VNCKALDDGEAFTLARIPHNHYFTESGVRKNKVYSGAVSLHTGIYMFVDKRTGAEDESDSYWTPAAKFIIEIDGVDCGFDTLSEYLNFLKKRDLSFLSKEYIMRIPGWNCFSANPDGEGQSWKLLETCVRITLDGADYLVAGERMNLQYPERVITLYASGRFENICLSSVMQIEQPEPLVTISYSSDMQRRIHIANETLTAGNAVSLRLDGRVERALPVHAHYGRLYGIALSGASAGEELEVQTGNRVFVKDWGLQRGAKYYLRKNAVSLSNISPEPLYEKTDTETMFACLGIAESSETLNIESGMYQQYLFE